MVFLTHYLCRCLGFFFKTGLTAIQVVKTPGDFPRHLNMYDLVLAYRDIVRLADDNIGGLQEWIT